MQEITKHMAALKLLIVTMDEEGREGEVLLDADDWTQILVALTEAGYNLKEN